METSLGQALTQQNWKKYIVYKNKQFVDQESIFVKYYSRTKTMSFMTTFKKSKCVECLSDKFV